jgi:hypothetical protein
MHKKAARGGMLALLRVAMATLIFALSLGLD